MTPKDRELLEGMCNCYSVCCEDFDNTVKMVASARGRTNEDVKATLVALAKNHLHDKEYMTLRGKLPSDFPF